MKTYTFNRNGKIEKVPKERWCWEAIYSDGTVLKQFGDDGVFHQFAEIDQSKLRVFRMVADHTSQTFAIDFDSSKKLIHFYRRYRLNVGTPDYQELTFYVFGYQKGRERVLFFIYPDDRVVITDNKSFSPISQKGDS